MAAERDSEAVVGADAAIAPSSRAYRRRLANLTNVRTALADVIRKVEADDLEQKKARTMIYGLSILAGIIQGTDLEARLEALEAKDAAGARIER